MALRKKPWLSAGVLAAVVLFSAPSRSAADTMILVRELDSGGSIIAGTSSTFTLATLPSSSNPYSTGGSFTGISITVTSTSGNSSNVNSLTTTVAAKPSGSFDSGHQLQVIVTDDGFLNASPGGTAAVTNDPGASSGISGGVNNLIGGTGVQSGTLGSLTSLGMTPTASDTSPGGPSDPNTTANVTDLPGQYAMTQTITIRAIENSAGSIDANSTFGGTLSSTIVTTPAAAVPAPAGLLLALTAIPVLGLRRGFRRKTSA